MPGLKGSFTEYGLKGLERVVKNLNAEIARIEGATLAGLIRAQIEIRRSMEYEPPLIPVDMGNLRASYFTVTSKGGVVAGSSPKFKSGRGASGRIVSAKTLEKLSSGHPQALDRGKAEIAGENPKVMMGFSAFYAVFVHEMVGPINWSRPGSGAKWFEKAIKRKKNEILKIIAESARIKK